MLKNVFKITKQNSLQKKHILWVGRLVDFKKPYLFLDLAKRNYMHTCSVVFRNNLFATFPNLRKKGIRLL